MVLDFYYKFDFEIYVYMFTSLLSVTSIHIINIFVRLYHYLLVLRLKEQLFDKSGEKFATKKEARFRIQDDMHIKHI